MKNQYGMLMTIVLLLGCLEISPVMQAVSPPPDGGYGGQNTAEGTNALFNLTTGVWNSAVGFRALYNNATGIRNTGIGYRALYNNNGPFNVSGLDNVAVGANALLNNTTGSRNVAIGSLALQANVTGSNNIAIGDRALWQLNGASGVTAIGDSFYSDADSAHLGRRRECNRDISPTAFVHAYDIFIGEPPGLASAPGSCSTSGALGTHSVHIVVDELVPGSGGVFVGGVNNNPIAGSPVAIGLDGRLGVAASSKRFKNDIKPMEQSSEAILALKPVTFRYNPAIDPHSYPQFGLVAEDVEKVNPDLVVRDKQGKPYSVRYEAVNAMLLNEFLKEHRKSETLEATVARQQKQIDALTAGLQKVSAQLEMDAHSRSVALANP